MWRAIIVLCVWKKKKHRIFYGLEQPELALKNIFPQSPFFQSNDPFRFANLSFSDIIDSLGTGVRPL